LKYEIGHGPGDDAAHVPVLLRQSLELLNVTAGKLYVDATAGGGGHLGAIMAAQQDQGGAAKVIGIDRDSHSLQALQERFGEGCTLLHANFSQIKECMQEIGVSTIDGGILADLGVSSMQLDQASRGFSFMREGPLDMRMDPTQTTTAEQLINRMSEEELANIIFKYGEERFSRAIARQIVRERPLRTTSELADVVSRSFRHQKKRIAAHSKKRGNDPELTHPATRTFQAIRIAVNNELSSLEKFLEDGLSLLAPGARLVVITFHSLEDRVVKQFLRRAAAPCVCPPRQPVCTCQHKPELLIMTRKPVVADEKEVLANIRSRSAKLRAGEKL
jgi:16S rRNA (cytosine1402-N4)-methyltransferase